MSIKQTPEDRATLDLVPQDIKNQMHYDVIKLPIQLEFTNYNNDKISAEPLGYLSRIGDIRQSKIDSDDFCCNIFHILCTSYEPNIDTHDNMVLVCQTGTSLIAYLIDDKKLQHALIQFLTISETDLVSNKDVTQVLEAIIDKTEYSCIITYDNIIQDDLVGKSKSQSNINHTNTSTQNTTTQNTSKTINKDNINEGNNGNTMH